MNKLLIPCTAAVLIAAASLPPPAAAQEPLVTRSAEGYTRDSSRDANVKSPFLEEHEADRATVKTRPKGDDGSRVQAAGAGDFWVYDAGATASFDYDGDGYYHYLTIHFDVDTYFVSAYVYAMLFVSADGETWEHLWTTDDFLVEGTTPLDEYEVETELVSGYPPGLYDVLIEIYDADFAEYVDEFGPAQSSALALLPLEDTTYDSADVTITITEEHGGGGAASWTLLGLLGAGVVLRRMARA